MIVPMKKVSIVVLDATRKESLKTLRKLGVVHLEAVEGKGATLSAYRDTAAAVEKAISILEEVKLPKKLVPRQLKLGNEAAQEEAKQIVALSDKKKTLFEKISQNTNELERLSKWGEVDPAALASLAEKGIFLYLYEIPDEKYASIGAGLKTIVVNSSNKVTRFLLSSESEVTERPADMPPEAYAVPLPEKSTKSIRTDILTAKQEISRIESELLDAKKYVSALKSYKAAIASDIEFETVYSGMEHDDEVADARDASTRLAWLTGYVPEDLLGTFRASCRTNSWAYTIADPSEEDVVPTKLHNNKLVSIIYPLTDFLDVTPGYREFDISSWFLLFFCIFFAMIFADAGYGALIALVGLILLAKSKKPAPIHALVIILGLCTMVWGTMTCSWFGIETDKLPAVLRNISFAPVSAAKNPENYNNNQKVFCFILALIQLSVAHIKCFISNRKSLKCIGDLGSLMQVWGMFYVVMNMVVDGTKYPLGITEHTQYVLGIPLPFLAIGVLLVGFVMSFIFSNYEGSIGASVLESCKNIISVLLGIVNVFSDIVSYIRLWAVALAGAAISSTVNTMAGPMLGKLVFVLFALILLVFGHGLNMMLNLLSVIVHGVRLNTLEFSQHLGMTWSGTKYSPFRERAAE